MRCFAVSFGVAVYCDENDICRTAPQRNQCERTLQARQYKANNYSCRLVNAVYTCTYVGPRLIQKWWVVGSPWISNVTTGGTGPQFSRDFRKRGEVLGVG